MYYDSGCEWLIGKELLLDRVRQGLKTLCFGDKIGVVLETLLDTPCWCGLDGRDRIIVND